MTQDEYPYPLLRRGAAPGQRPSSDRRWTQRRSLPTTLLAGHPSDIAALHRRLLRRPPRDYEVIGCCLSAPASAGDKLHGLPVFGGPDDVVDVASRLAVDAVAVLPSSGSDGAALRRLQRDLSGTRVELLLAPGGSGATRSRRCRPVREGRPGLHGARALVKGSFDRVAATVMLALLLPVFVGIAVAVKAASRGPVFVRLARVGRDGRQFHLLKFRTTDPQDPGHRPFGDLLRRCSIDELPQLLNVLRGDMSLVGPRPGLPHHSAPAEHSLRPGLFGPATAGRRPGRYGDDGVPIDLDYAENWSLMLDLTILRRSFAAALRGGRAA